MAEILIAASLITAFIAGIAALFAPCCITVLLPAYLGSVFRQRRTVLLMTFVFFLGLLTVFLPLGLGIAALGQFFSQYHTLIFMIGAVLLLSMGASLLLGIHFNLPFSAHSHMKIQGAGSVFVLGLFSGFATLCCAPVLAGVLALSLLPGSMFWGTIYALAYVGGMVAPLFIIAYFVDHTNLTRRFSLLQKKVSYTLGKRTINIRVADAVSGLLFVLMGIFILYLAWSNRLAMGAGDYQTSMNIFMSNLSSSIEGWLVKMSAISSSISIVLLIALLAVLCIIFIKRWRAKRSFP